MSIEKKQAGPISTAPSDSWDNFKSLDNFYIEFADALTANVPGATIYRNGNNTVAITLTFEMTAQDGGPFQVTEDLLLHACDLVDNISSQRMNWQASSGYVAQYDNTGWWYTNTRGDFGSPVAWSAGGVERIGDVASNVSQITFYVYCKDVVGTPFSKSVAATIEINGVTYSTAEYAHQNTEHALQIATTDKKSYLHGDMVLTNEFVPNMPAMDWNYFFSINQDVNQNSGLNIIKCINNDPISNEIYTPFDGNYHSDLPGLCLFGIGDGDYSMFYNLWKFGDPATATVKAPTPNVDKTFTFNTPVNTQAGAVCITRVEVKGYTEDLSGSSNSYYAFFKSYGNITIFDQFGNSGQFYFYAINDGKDFIEFGEGQNPNKPN